MGYFNTLFDTSTSDDYRNSYNQTNKNLQQQYGLINQYTGNNGYNNAINQGLRGAAVTAGAAGQQSQQAARNAGMTKGRAANMGATNAANAYSNNFNSQQGMAANMGNQSINATANLANQYGNQADRALNEQNSRFNRANQTFGNIMGAVGNIGSGLVGLLSDENMKNIDDKINHISDLVTNIEPYLYDYKDPSYPGADDKEHIGPMAQDLEKNPVTKDAVNEDENGIKHVDTNRLTLSNTALIADLAKRLADIEEKE